MILLTGGAGTLGTELKKYLKHHYSPSRKDLDITSNPKSWDIVGKEIIPEYLREAPSLIVHAAAFTDLVRAEKEKDLCYATNVLGTRNLASLGIPMLYISTEYVFDGTKGNYVEEDYANPLNFYALTKLLGEYEARKAPGSVVVRCLFKPRPFRHEFACTDQFTSGSYADQIAPEIAWAIQNFDKLPPTIHIGSGRKSTWELARESRPDVKPCKVGDIGTVRLPRDTSLNAEKWKELRNGNKA